MLHDTAVKGLCAHRQRREVGNPQYINQELASVLDTTIGTRTQRFACAWRAVWLTLSAFTIFYRTITDQFMVCQLVCRDVTDLICFSHYFIVVCSACVLFLCWMFATSLCLLLLIFVSRNSKVKCTLVQALRLCTGRTAHRGSRGVAFHDHGTKSGWGVSFTPRPLFASRERPDTHCTGGRVGPRAGMDRCGKSRPPHRDSIPGPSRP